MATLKSAVNTTSNDVQELITTAMDTEATSCTLWDRTGDILAENSALFADGIDKKDMSKSFTKILDEGHSPDSIPEEGMSRSGEMITLRKKGNKIKWSSWTATARIVQNTSDIFKGIIDLGYDTIFPNGVMISRYDLLNLLKEHNKNKPGETPVETFTRCVELATKKVIECELVDVDLMETLLIKLNVAVSELKDSVSA